MWECLGWKRANGGCVFNNETPMKFDNSEAITPPAKRKPKNIIPLTTSNSENTEEKTLAMIENISKKRKD